MAAACAACTGIGHVDPVPAQKVRSSVVAVAVGDRRLDLHLAAPLTSREPAALVLYASGDGGWFGAAIGMFDAIADAGFHVAGFSTRSLLHRQSGEGGRLSVAEIADIYETLLAKAASTFGLPDGTPVVLAGWSRGASLAVLVGGARRPPPHLAGVIAIGLAEDDSLDVREGTDDDPEPGGAALERGELDMYALIDRLAPRRCAVIQATGDSYLPAARARLLLGADTTWRRLFTVDATNHRFANGGASFVANLRQALQWTIDAPDGRPGQ